MSIKIDKSLILNNIKLHYGFKSDAEFARFLSIKPQTLASWYSRNSYDAELLYAKCVGISGDFLLSGIGDMMRQPYSNGMKAPINTDGSKTIGNRLLTIREANNYSSKDFAELLKIDPSQYSKIEAGKLSITLAQCINVCGVFSTSLDWLVFGKSLESDYEEQKPDPDYKLIAELALENSGYLKEIRNLEDRLRDMEKAQNKSKPYDKIQDSPNLRIAKPDAKLTTDTAFEKTREKK